MKNYSKSNFLKKNFSALGAVFGLIFYFLLFWFFVSALNQNTDTNYLDVFLKISGIVFPISIKNTVFFPQIIATHLLLMTVYATVFSFMFKKINKGFTDNLPLKGGVIASVFYLVSLIFAFTLILNLTEEHVDTIILISLFTGHAYPVLSTKIMSSSPYISFFGVLFIITTIYFIVGATIGKLVEIRKRKRTAIANKK